MYVYMSGNSVICENSPFRKFTNPFGPQPKSCYISHVLAEGRRQALALILVAILDLCIKSFIFNN